MKKIMPLSRPQWRAVLLSFLFLTLLQKGFSQSLRFTDTNYAHLGNDASLHLTSFTLEAWIKIEGTGTTTSTGSGGVTLVPLIAKGRAEAENALVDVNYVLGIESGTNKLTADFEDNATSLNHPVTSTTAVGSCWTHVAATYNTATNTWKLYINGALDNTLALGASFTPQSLSNVNAAIGTSINSAGVTEGFFTGRIDEVRIWNIVRTDAEILANYNAELTSGTGLVSRWGFNEGLGTTGANSVAGGPVATLIKSPLWKPGFNQGNPFGSALDFNGTSNYVTFGAAPALNTSTFTLEAWINIEGTGVTTVTSGAGGGGFEGATAAVPLVTKGRGEGESPANINMNYFMGLVGNKLAADFEDGAGPNHSVIGTAVIPLNTWTHVAATYEPVTAAWNLYINGVLDKTLDIGSNIVPVSTSIQHASVGTAMTSTGVAAGFFNGKIDEVRIWNVARTGADILANYNAELSSGTGLVGRWGFNDGCGVNAVNAISGGVNGTLSSSTGPVWVNNFNSIPPSMPVNTTPLNNATNQPFNPNLCATVSDPNGGNLQVRFYGRKKVSTGSKFSIIGLPDTQFYTEEPQGANSSGGGHNGIFKAQTQWIADHRIDSNIAFVVQLGDCTQNGDMNEIEWKRADTSMKKIENPNVPITDGIPYGICVGNHDQGPNGNGDPNGTTTFYNQYFGQSRFTGRGYYGGHYGSNNDNHYELFNAGGIDFIHISIEYFPNGTTAPLQAILDWADALLKTHSNRKGILSTHNMLSTGNPANFQGPGQKIYDDLKDNPNLVLMLAGHVPGEGRRTDVFNGNTIHTILSDYQSGYTNGGNGYLKILQFLPGQNLLNAKTYSPYSNTFLTGTSNQFSLPVNLAQGFSLIGTASNIPSGSSACFIWPSLEADTEYEWYAEAFDGEHTLAGPVWSFRTNISVLPVELVNFTAVKEQARVKLSWQTLTETNSSHFEIERSADGRLFEKTGTVTARGYSNLETAYKFYDDSPLNGNNYYRLKQVDRDGRFDYSGIVNVFFGSKGNPMFRVYPNPVNRNSFNLVFSGKISGNVMITVFDESGRQVYKETQPVQNNTMRLTHNLLPGIYIITVQSDKINESRTMVVK
jgi:Concanavalin A-like lectin/glucanases superfamily/Secretion system C-terminal sorting domain/Calcineurin-like phosphoesterase